MIQTRTFTFGILAATAFALPSFAADSNQSSSKMNAEQQKMMQNMEMAAKVSDQHKSLDYLLGSWTTTTKMWHEKNATPEVSTGTTRFESALGGRFVQETFDGTAMGKPFQGVGYIGYDNMKKKYISLWMDNMSTGVSMLEGESSDQGKTIKTAGDVMCPMTGKPQQMRSIMTKVSNNEVHYEHYMKDPKGAEFKALEVVYKR